MAVKELWSKFYTTLSSVRNGIVLLLLVVIFSALGTVVLQRPATDPGEIERAYSPATLFWLDRLGFTDIYHAWWFAALLGLVSLSIIFASLERWPKAWKFYAQPTRRPEEPFRASLKDHREFKIGDAAGALEAAGRALRKLGLKPQRVEENGEVSLYAERHRLSVLAVFIVHLSLLSIFAGYLVDAIYSYRGELALTKGESSHSITVHRRGADRQKLLPFTIRCDGLGQENYADGSPKRWWSDLVVLQNGREVERKQIAVNDPLTYQGIRFYQANFGTGGKLEAVELQVRAAGSDPRTINLAPARPVQLDAENTVTLGRFVPDYYLQDGEVYQRSDNPENPAIELLVNGKGGQHRVWLFPRTSFGAQDQRSGYSFELRDLRLAYFTGLEVSYHPGQWSVWAGVVLIAVGLGIAFYLVHMRFWVMTTANAQQEPLLWVGGACNKNRDRFERRFAQLTQAIEEELRQGGQFEQKPPETPAQERKMGASVAGS
jgi:cytochrome c biogenesis protein